MKAIVLFRSGGRGTTRRYPCILDKNILKVQFCGRNKASVIDISKADKLIQNSVAYYRKKFYDLSLETPSQVKSLFQIIKLV